MESQVKTKGEGPGKYRLSLGDKSVLAERQPDLYFVIVLSGKEHKGYLKGLKKIFADWASAPQSETSGDSATPSLTTPTEPTSKAPLNQDKAAEQRAAEAQRRDDERAEARARAKEIQDYRPKDPNEEAQERIDNLTGYPHLQVEAYVSAYNNETVSLAMKVKAGELATRYGFRLPRRAPLLCEPPLAECYDPNRDQYTWPRRYPVEEK